MKPFCALLLVGIIAYVQGNDDPCDKYAANTIKKGTSKDDEHNDQYLPLKTFLQNIEIQMYVTKASESNVGGSDAFCSGPTHGATCKAVGYWRRITHQPDLEKPKEEGADKLQFDTVFVSEGKDYAVQYKMSIKGDNFDDYIFKGTETAITATIIYPDGKTENVTDKLAKTEVYQVLKSRFALWYASDKGFAIYMMCDASAMWVSYSSSIVAANQQSKTEGELEKWVNKLIAKIPATQTAPKLVDIAVEMTKQIYHDAIPKAQ